MTTVTPHFCRTRFVSITPAGDDTFHALPQRTRCPVTLSFNTLQLWLAIDDKEAQPRAQVRKTLTERYERLLARPLVDRDLEALDSTLQTFLETGLVEPDVTEYGYDKTATIYEARAPMTQRMFDVIGRHTTEAQREVVLDVGCGTGRILEGIARLGAGELHGIDVARPMVVVARERFDKLGLDATFQHARAEKLPLDDGSCSLVVAGSAFHWFTKGEFWDEVARIVRPDHRIVVATHTIDFDKPNVYADANPRLHLPTLVGLPCEPVRELPAWVNLLHYEQWEVGDEYPDRTSLEHALRAWSFIDAADVEGFDWGALDRIATWPYVMPIIESVAVLQCRKKPAGNGRIVRLERGR